MDESTVNIVSWNMARKKESWRYLLEMEFDLAFLQEACRPPADIAERVEIDPAAWPVPKPGGRVRWRTAIAAVSRQREEIP